MKKKPQWLKTAEKHVKTAADTSSTALGKLHSQAKQATTKLNAEYKISEHASDLKKATVRKAKDLDDRYEIKKKAKAGVETGVEVIGKATKGAKKYADKKGITKKVKRIGKFLEDGVLKPAVKMSEETGVTKRIGKISKAAGDQYGKTRARIKPYYAPETPDKLLRDTKHELIKINARILQISPDEAEKLANKFGAAIVSKVAGAASVGTLLGLVSTFGTASTGTAIAGLHGAAATNATLYWVGSLLGGGMATGALLTGGVALAVGIGVYKFISSEARRFEDLSDSEREIVEATGFLIAAINDVLNDPSKSLNADEADLLLQNTLKPLYQSLLDHCEEICGNLDNKNALLFRRHAIPDFKNSVIEGFEFFIQAETASRRRYPEYAIAGVIYALLTQSAVDDSRESQLALDAIRRSKVEWNDASESQLSSDLAQYSPGEMQGLANNVKGIYHELLFVDDYNGSHDDTYAELFSATNHPGADVQIKSKDTDEVISELQLKATETESLITEHFEKYPDINVLATEEIAIKSGLAGSSGISNDDITEHMDGDLGDIADNTIVDRTVEGVEIVGLVAAGREAIRVLGGKQSASEAGINVVKALTVTATSTALVAYLFS